VIHFLKLLLNDSQKIIGIIGKFYFIKKSTSVDQLECIFFILLGDYILLLIIGYKMREKLFFILKKYYEKLREKFLFNYQRKIEIKIIMRETARELLRKCQVFT